MSTLLYSLGQWAAKARVLVVALWVLLLAVLGAGALFLGKGANGPIEIPGTESQAALDTLGHTFPEVSGSSAQLIVVAPEGQRVDEEPYRQAITDAAQKIDRAKGVKGVQYPFSELAPAGLSKDGRAALMQIQVEGSVDKAPVTATDAIVAASDHLNETLPSGSQASYGGQVFSVSVPHLSAAEAIGVVVAFIVLIFTLGSLLAAGMPLLIALLGVGVSMAGIFFVTAFMELTSVTPMLALMIGLAVGIDYTLFIVSRHQEQLKQGIELRESIARATATSGSAVVFAGLTVIIALVGMFVAGIPFLTALGVAAAAAVGFAVLIAVTLTPSLLSFAGYKILKKKDRRRVLEQRAKDAHPSTGQIAVVTETTPAAKAPSRVERFFAGWVKASTKRPILTVVAVLVVLGVATLPALQLRLALPDATSLAEDDPARVTYELVDEHYGPGANGPLLLTGSIITSTDPLGLMDDLKKEIERIPGVAEVPLATPNQGADTGILQVTPTTGPHSPDTEKLVQTLRDHHDEWLDKYGVDLKVTGFTAVGIDVSAKLFTALIPFTIFVVGLSLILLAMVFRSVWVPIKATLGYLLSVGSAFGAVVAVFQWGWFGDALNLTATGPVLSFMPIILMGVLFGLAMDYEVFLVSRMREEVAHGTPPNEAIHKGFVSSSGVVTAAAIIMFAVFVAFVPEGEMTIKTIALGLAVGVFVDAFVVRMTLVPAVLAMLGKHAWYMPRWMQKVLPHFDVEGEGITRELEYRQWPEDQPDAVIASEGLELDGGTRVGDIRLSRGEALVLNPQSGATRALVRALVGRGVVRSGVLKVGGLLVPERAGALRSRATVARISEVRGALKDKPHVLVIDASDEGERHPAALRAVRSALEGARAEAKGDARPAVTIVVIGSAEVAEQIVPGGTTLRDVPVAKVSDEGRIDDHTRVVPAAEGATV